MGPVDGHKDAQRAGAPLLWDRLRELGLFTLEKRRLWGRRYGGLPLPGYKKAGKGLFVKECRDKEEWLYMERR